MFNHLINSKPCFTSVSSRDHFYNCNFSGLPVVLGKTFKCKFGVFSELGRKGPRSCNCFLGCHNLTISLLLHWSVPRWGVVQRNNYRTYPNGKVKWIYSKLNLLHFETEFLLNPFKLYRLSMSFLSSIKT